LAGVGFLDPVFVFLCAGAGNLTGDLCWYLLGYFGHFEALVRRFPQLVWLVPQIEQMKAEVLQRAPRMLLIAKLALGVASIPTLVAAGVARVPWQRVVLVQLLGETIWTGALVLFGLFLGQYVSRLQKDLRIAALVSSVIFVLLLLWVIRRGLKTQNRPPQQPMNPGA
jgi:membrane protein DedA with SNARE-associated domain